jgi:assimilatory nitrate reductase catalytic subunit
MLVCSCHAVFESTVRQAVANGAGCIDAIGDTCGAGKDCGSCISHLEDILDELDRRLDRSHAA